RDAEELHDALLGLVVLRPEQEWETWFHELARDRRAARVDTPGGPFWLATERRALVEALFPGAPIDPDVRVPAMRGREDGAADPETAAVEAAPGPPGPGRPPAAGGAGPGPRPRPGAPGAAPRPPPRPGGRPPRAPRPGP